VPRVGAAELTVRGVPRPAWEAGRASPSDRGVDVPAGRSEANATILGLGRPALPAPFMLPGFAGLWVSASSGSLARVVTQLALSWVTLEATGSPFVVGVVAAARMAPQLVLGIPAGALADWLDRRLLIVAANAAGVVLLLGLVGLAVGGLVTTPILVGVSLLYGALDTVRMSATQAYAFELVRSSRATSGMALMNLGTQILSLIGGLIGGYTLEQFGSPATFGLIGLALLVATVAPMLQAGPARPARPIGPRDRAGRPAPAASEPGRRPGVDLRRALTLLARNRLLAVLALSIILAEIFGFASMTLLPTFARDVFEVGASGLGMMLAARSAGGILGLLALSRLGAEGRSGLVFASAAGTFGLALLLFAVSPSYALALGLLAIVGIGAAVMDTLGQTLLQRNADERERGTAMGVWVFSVGFGPVGHLALGAAASSFGAPLTQAVSGLMLMLVAGLMGLHAPLRRAR
jgi:MFS family permease